MSEPIAIPSEELLDQWDVDRALNPVWKALSFHNAADAIKQMQRDNSDVKRGTLLALLAKFSEEQRNKQLCIAHQALGEYLLRDEIKEPDKVKFILDTFHLWSEDGTFTFPDGETYHRDS